MAATPTIGHSDQKLQKAQKKSEKAGKRLDRARRKMPKKTEYHLERVYDEQAGKAKYVLKAVEKDRMFKPDSIGKRAFNTIGSNVSGRIHSKIAENENENDAVKAAHRAEQKAESLHSLAKNHRKSSIRRKSNRVKKLGKKKMKADINLEYRQFIHDSPQPDRKTLQGQMRKRLQKKRIKREYIKAQKAGRTAREAYGAATKTANTATGIAKKLQEAVSKNRTILLSVGALSLVMITITATVSSCGSMLGSTISATMASTYISKPSEIDATDLSMTLKEMELQDTIDSIESDRPGYDEYRYNLGEIGHDPFTLISYLSAANLDFTAAGVESQVQSVFDGMYSLDTEEVTETRTRTVTRTGTREVEDSDGTISTEEYTYEEEEEYTVRILQVTLTTTPMDDIVSPMMDADQAELYSAYTETKGGLQVFASPVDYNWHSHISSYFGYRKNPNTGNRENHRGLDIAVPTGTTVYATHDGTVTTAGYDGYYGNYIEITGNDGYSTKYAHLDSISVGQGQRVSMGTAIGKSGNTGSSTGSHLHIECLYNGEYYNPLFYFESGTQTLYGEPEGSNPSDVTPPESYDDETVRKLINEAEKYLGMPYTFGGTPPTSFDCSGYVSWVFTNSGVYSLPRTTAQGIYNQCTKVPTSEAKAGDLVFFTGTYNAGRPVTHVGIYCGNGIMIHCGDPIKYSSINTSYWQSHFYAFGRLN